MATIIWKGISSETINGLIICELPPITKPKLKTSITKVDGRDGDIVEELGYESYTKIISIGLAHNFNIDEVIKYFTGSGELIMSNEPNKVYNSQIIDKVDYQKLLRFKKATVGFYTQPYKYLKNEQTITLDITSETSININNQGLEIAKPIIKLTGSGTVEISINGIAIFRYIFPDTEPTVTIDSLEEEAYTDTKYMNRYMYGKFPTLNSGNNTISWSGTLTKIEVQPKSRWL